MKDNSILLESKNSYLGANKLDYDGKINLEPFDFKINTKIDRLNLKKFLPNKIIFKEVLSKEFLLNENFNGSLTVKSENLKNSNFFNEILLTSNYVGEKIELSNSKIFNKKIGSLNLDFGNVFLENNDLLFKGKFSFEIFNKNKFYRKFLIPKKNQSEIDKVYFGLNINLSNLDTKIFFLLSLDKDDPKVNDELDDLIYSFNNKSITINNWISLRSFVNKILSSYSG